jgi:hypothetical protein
METTVFVQLYRSPPPPPVLNTEGKKSCAPQDGHVTGLRNKCMYALHAEDVLHDPCVISNQMPCISSFYLLLEK